MRTELLAAVAVAILAVPVSSAASMSPQHKCDTSTSADGPCDNDHKCEATGGVDHKCDD